MDTDQQGTLWPVRPTSAMPASLATDLLDFAALLAWLGGRLRRASRFKHHFLDDLIEGGYFQHRTRCFLLIYRRSV